MPGEINNYKVAVQYLLVLSLFFLPTYTVRFSIWRFELNLLLVWVVFVLAFFVYWLFKHGLAKEFRNYVLSQSWWLRLLIFLFFLSGTISVMVGGFSIEKLGAYIVLFLEPLALFLSSAYTFKKIPGSKEVFLRSAYVFISLAGVLAVLQYFTLITLPHAYWGNAVEPKRALAFFEYPNAYALFVAPLLVLLLPHLLERLKTFNLRKDFYPVITWSIGVIGLVLSMSRGGWVGFVVAAGIGIFALASKSVKKIALVIAVIGVLVVYMIPTLRYRAILPFMGEKSAVSRLSIWQTAREEIKDSPVMGKGLLGFSNNWEKYNQDPNLGHYKYPHNVLLSFWVDTGILGVVSFFGLCLWILIRGLRNKKNVFQFGAALFIITLLVHGLVDSPYFKNDLAMLFWLVIALTV